MKEDKDIISTLDKIKKIYDKAKSLEKIGSIDEAETFAANANRMLLEHNLSEIDVELHEIDTGKNKIDMNEVGYGNIKSDGTWEINLLSVLAYHNLCKTLRINDRKNKIFVIGKPENIEITLYLYDVIKPLIKNLSNKSYNDTIQQLKDNITSKIKDCKTEKDAISAICKIVNMHPIYVAERLVRNKKGGFTLKLDKMGIPSPRKIWIRSYLNGAARGIDIKLDNNRVESDKMNELIIRNDAKIDEFMQKEIGDTYQKDLVMSNKDQTAFIKGIRDGLEMEMVKGVRNGDSAPIKLLDDGNKKQ